MRRFLNGLPDTKRLCPGPILLLGAMLHPVLEATARAPVPAVAAHDPQRSTPAPIDGEPVRSPDGRHLAFIRRTSAVPDDFDRFPSQLMLSTIGAAGARPAATGSPPDHVRPIVRNPRWSLDGRFIYVLAAAYAVSDMVVRIDRVTGRQDAVIDGNTLAVIQDGPWRGHLLVRRHKYRPRGGAYDPYDVVRPDGRVRFTIPGSDRDDGDAVWLKSRGWTAR